MAFPSSSIFFYESFSKPFSWPSCYFSRDCLVPMSWHAFLGPFRGMPCHVSSDCPVTKHMPCHVSSDCPATSTSRAMAWPPFSFMHLSRSICHGLCILMFVHALAFFHFFSMPCDKDMLPNAEHFDVRSCLGIFFSPFLPEPLAKY